MFRLKKTKAGVDTKFILIAGFCLLAVFGVFLRVGRQEKYALRRQLDEALKKKDTMDYRAQEILKTITPLKEELESLKKLLPPQGDDHSSPKPEFEPEFSLEPKKIRESLPESKSKKTAGRNSS